jgi:hypothetical protein
MSPIYWIGLMQGDSSHSFTTAGNQQRFWGHFGGDTNAFYRPLEWFEGEMFEDQCKRLGLRIGAETEVFPFSIRAQRKKIWVAFSAPKRDVDPLSWFKTNARIRARCLI